MIRNKLKLSNFYKKLIAKEKIPYKEALGLYEALHNEAVSLGTIDLKYILDGLETDLKIAKTINGLS